ncbi:pyridoxal phosphate-dependent aminotransferase [Novosphingobium sediminicola]|uniref:Histidinol-phosphate aminotransferase n=1 Tax=Novosphingobium sediminicola TaxID=563162 RepID=A0A7W6CD56_9SPHN|nr:histidinol-phosphate transaminase [Novosphingobium sediminicola]MBB3953642.1 histidinol-phosphate aminotransferase [Novosphingobium sediminicola]
MRITRRSVLPVAAGGLLAPGLLAAAPSSMPPPQPEHSGDVKARLGVTENPFGPSPAARRAIIASVAEAPYYPHSEAALRQKIAAQESLPPDRIALSSGSLDALTLLTVAIAAGGRVLAPRPTYSTHLAYAARQGIETDWVNLRADHHIDLDAMLGAIKPETRLVYLCNPNNPTGLRPDPEQLRAFCVAASRKAPVLVDEAYFELAPDPHRQSMGSLVGQGHDVIVTRTFSKVYGLAGLRIAYTLAQPQRIRQLNARITTSRNQAGLAAAQACLGDAAYLAGAIAYLKQCREMIYRICEANRLRYLKSDGTFVYIDCSMPAADLQARLATRSVEVRLFEGDAYRNWMRVGTATPDELAYFGQVLPGALAG